MADALCGPSNALQNFQKHAAVDRSLQQDRLGLRHHPSQTFRSTPAPGPSYVDADFQRFQSAPAPGPSYIGADFRDGQAVKRIFPTSHRAPQIPVAQPIIPSWASDFQQLHLNNIHRPSPPSSSLHTPLQSVPTSTPWHQEFLRHQQQQPDTTIYQPQPLSASQTTWRSPMSAYTPMTGMSMFDTTMQQPQAQQGHTTQEPVFDDAAFAQAFDAIDNQVDEMESKGKGKAVEREPVVKFDLSHASMEMGDVTGEFDYEATSSNLATDLQHTLKDAGWEALDAFQRAHEHEFMNTGSKESLEVSQTIEKMRSDDERSSQSQTPDLANETVRIGADTIPSTQQEAEPVSTDAEADELSRTAGQLIENLKDEQSAKFQQSTFMQLMRQLRDREVRIEGDAMIKQESHPGGRFYPADAFVQDQPEAF